MAEDTAKPAPAAEKPTELSGLSTKRKPLLGRSDEFPRPGLLKRPRGVMGKIRAERPKAMPVPVNRTIGAYTKPEVFERWSADAAGIRAVEIDDSVITMFGAIGEDYWTGEGVTAKKITAQLRAIGPRPIEVQINSPGGDMFEGIAVYNVLREHPQPVTVKVMGIAASAASVIAMAGDRIEIGAASFIMIHNCSVMAAGNRHDFAEVSDFLAPFDQAMADLYAQRTAGDAKTIAKWMDDETFMSGSTAIERGFADAMLPAEKMKVDDATKAHDQDVNKLRAMELRLMRGGETRAAARAHVNEIRGTTDSAPAAGTTDSAGKDDWSGLTGLLATIRS